MKITFLILLLLIILLVLPIALKITLKFDAIGNRGFFEIKLWVFKLKFYRFKFKNGRLVLKNRKETKEINIEINMENVDFANELQKQLFQRIYLKYLKMFFTIGSTKNACNVALLAGALNTILAVLKTYIKTKKPTSEIEYFVYPQYNQSNGVITLRTIFSISITNILIAVLKTKSIINKRKEKKNETRRIQTSC